MTTMIVYRSVMLLFWVDDRILYAKDAVEINKVIESLTDGFLLEREDDMAGLLGLKIVCDIQDEPVTLTQEGLTDNFLAAMNLQDSNPNHTLVDKIPLSKDLGGESCCEGWNY